VKALAFLAGASGKFVDGTSLLTGPITRVPISRATPITALPGYNPFPWSVVMGKVIDLADLDKAIKLVETAMKTDAKKAKLREEQRKKAEAALEAFNDNYAARSKDAITSRNRSVIDLEKAIGVTERELGKTHPLTTKLDDLINKAKRIPYDPRYAELDKAIHALEDWDVVLEKTDQPKLAIKLIETARAALETAKTEVTKAYDAYYKVAEAAKKDLEGVTDPDLRKELAKVLEGELP
jgi:exonuclease VII small subunit